MSSINNPPAPEPTGPPGPATAATVPMFIPEGTVFEAPTETQTAVVLPIYVDGTLLLSGSMVVL